MTFDEVAKLIDREGSAPWLPIALAQFSNFVGGRPYDHTETNETFKQMERAADILIRWLPLFKHLPAGLPCPPSIEAALAVLPDVRREIARGYLDLKSRPPNVRREVCAAVILEAWKVFHGKPQPRSLAFAEACKAYWAACGCAPIGEIDDIDNWRRTAKKALASGHGWIGDRIAAVQKTL
jgi:hypothetical protein